MSQKDILRVIGNCFYEDSKNDRYFMQFQKGDETYQMGECALIQSEEASLRICEIQCIWMQENELYIECKRYYRYCIFFFAFILDKITF